MRSKFLLATAASPTVVLAAPAAGTASSEARLTWKNVGSTARAARAWDAHGTK